MTVVKVITEGPQGPAGPAGPSGSATLAGLTDVTGSAGTGKAPISDGAGHFPLTDVATQAELDAEATARAAADTAEASARAAAITALSSVYQPLDSDLTAIAALNTTPFGRAFLALADAAALRVAGGLVIGTDVEAHDADLTTIAGLIATNDDILQRKAGAWTNRTIAQLLADLAAAGTTFQPLDSDLTAIAALNTTSFGRAVLALADAAALRTAAGLGTSAVLNVPASGDAAVGEVVKGSDTRLTDTRTPTDATVTNAKVSASAAIAYSKLNLAAAIVASDFSDAEIAALAGLVSAANKLPYFTGSGTAALADFTAFARTILDDADAATALTTLGGQPLDATLTALAALTTAADKLIYSTGSDAFATTTLSAFIRTLIDDADATTARTTLSITTRDQLRRNAIGVLDECMPRFLLTSAGAPTSQTIYGALMGLRAGDLVTGIAMMNSTAAAGTAPTTVRVGIADSTGKILALSNNLNAAANFPTTSALLPFASQYTVLTDGAYYACFVVNGTWGTTQPTIGRSQNSPAIFNALSGAAAPFFSWLSQTDLPAVNSSVTFQQTIGLGYWMAFYGTPTL